MELKHVKPMDGPIDEGTGGVGDRRIRDAVDDETGGLDKQPVKDERSGGIDELQPR